MRTQKDLVYLLLSMFILTIIWISASVKHNLDTSTVSSTLQLEVKPIVPRFDTETFDALKARNNIDPRFEVQTPATASASPTPTRALPRTTLTVTPTRSATQSGQQQ